jgi:hypothetical protein
MESFKRYFLQSEVTIEEQLERAARRMSQFERSLEELGVGMIHAHSPQAKGRIERLFGPIQ